MFDMATMWLPGFGPEPENTVPETVSTPTPLVSEIREAIKPARAVWPEMAADLWDVSFTDRDRMQFNVTALEIAARLPDGQKPTIDEARALNLFNGWGTASALFGPNPSPAWKGFRDDIEQVIGSADMDKVRAAVTTSFYTPPAVVRALWKGLQQMGFKGGNILDPSAGHGMFLANMPKAIAERSQVTAIEPDPAAAKILKALYAPYGVKVLESTFEAAPLPTEGFYDVVITNVPFGDFGVPERRNVPFRNFLIHDYFIAKAAEVVRPGGIVAVITSAGTMDKVTAKVRTYLGAKLRLLQAVRLPVEAFASFAGTEPVTDVLVFQRLDVQSDRNDLEWLDSMDLPSKHPSVMPEFAEMLDRCRAPKMNRWYVDKPANLLGKLERGIAQYSELRSTLKAHDIDWLAQLNARLAELPANVFRRQAKRQVVETVTADTALRPGSFVLSASGAVCIVEAVGSAKSVQGLPAKTIERIRGMIEVRDVARALFEAQANTDDEVAMGDLRTRLNETYDGFVKACGTLTSSANSRAFAGDPALPMLQALEVTNEDGSCGKAAVFSRRTVGYVEPVTHCDSVEEALQASLAMRGCVDEAWIAQLVGSPVDEVMDQLSAAGAVFRDPKTLQWVTASAYLSGNVRLKLREAEMAGGSWKENIEALQEVQPTDLRADEIRAGLGATWIPGHVYEAFITEFLGTEGKVGFDSVTGSWSLDCYNPWQIPQEKKNAYGVSGRLSPIELMHKEMNRQQATVSDPDPNDRKKRIIDQVKTVEAREKQAALNEQFVKWLWSDDERARKLGRIYNDRYNCIVSETFDGSHLVMPGFSNHYSLYPHQKNAIWRTVTSDRNTLLAHRVGFGKSLEMICSGMELRRLGVASKIAYVVPNATLGDFVKEFVRAYPSANLLVATEQDFAGNNRRRFLAKAASGDWDGVVLTHPSFERIRMSSDDVTSYVGDELARIEAAIAAITASSNGRQSTVKQLERLKAKWKARLEKNANRKGDQDDCMTFTEIGFDWLMVDEAHAFKNLFRFSKMERVAGLPDCDAERAFDMFLKCQHVTAKHDGKRGVTFATGTPVANSMAELHAMQRFLQPGDLDNADVEAFDAWASNFGEVVTALEIAPDGSGYRMNRRFSRFVNIPELMAIFRLTADIQVGDPPYLKLPACEREVISAKPSKLLKEFVETLVERAEKIRGGHVTPQEDNMLSVTNDGRKAALDMRLIAPGLEDDPNGKVNLCISKVLEIWRDTAEDRSTQVLFCDMGTPGGKGFSVYEDIRSKLVAAGVPEAEVAFAHDAHTHVARAKLAENVREGRIRIVIGSTQKLGVGVNIQTRLVALHHLDAPWRPADIEQREGRIIRQGNNNRLVKVYRYVTEQSFDAYLWQTLETKAKFIAQIMSGDKAIRTAEDLELAALSYAEVKALASGNPVVIEKAGVDAEVAKLAALRSGYMDATATAKRAIVELPRRIESFRRRKAGLEHDAECLAAMQAPILKVRGNPVAALDEIGLAIHDAAQSRLYLGGPATDVGFVGDLQITVARRPVGRGYRLALKGWATMEVDYNGGAVAARNAFEHLVDRKNLSEAISQVGEAIEYAEKQLVQYEAEAVKPFAQEARFRELLARQEAINAELDVREDVRQAA